MDAISSVIVTFLLLTASPSFSNADDTMGGLVNMNPRLRATRQLAKASGSSKVSTPADLCVASLDWTSEGGEILLNGQPFHLKGVSYFGFETPNEGKFIY